MNGKPSNLDTPSGAKALVLQVLERRGWSGDPQRQFTRSRHSKKPCKKSGRSRS